MLWPERLSISTTRELPAAPLDEELELEELDEDELLELLEEELEEPEEVSPKKRIASDRKSVV